MNIKEASKQLRIPKSLIRYYENIGLLKISRDYNNYRNFDSETLSKLDLIIHLKSLDLTLEDIRYILNLFEEPTSRSCNERSNAYIKHKIENIETRLRKQLFILIKLKRISELTANENYTKNKQEIFIELCREEDEI